MKKWFVIILIILLMYNTISYEYLYKKNISFSFFRSFFNKYLGGIDFINNKKSEEVFGELIEYSDIIKYGDGFRLSVNNNYLVPINYDGIVIYIGNNDRYGNNVIIENSNGIWVLYGNICNSKARLYDSVRVGDYVGEVCSNYLYLVYGVNNK